MLCQTTFQVVGLPNVRLAGGLRLKNIDPIKHKKRHPCGWRRNNWLPASERFTNFFDLTFWIDLSRMQKGEFFVSNIEPPGKLPSTSCKETMKPLANPLKQALVFNDLLESGIYTTQAELATHLGMSRARVTQTLNLLKLTPEILDTLLNLPDNQVHLFSERRLRPITQILSQKKQMAAFRKLCGRLGRNITPFKDRSI